MALEVRHSGSTTALKIDGTGLASFSNGIAFQSATTGSGTGTGYTLDSFEYGTWTPSLSAPASGTLAYTSSGSYTRIGDQVHIQAIITITTATSLPTSALIINNAPFNAKYTVASKYYLNSFPLSRGTGVILADRTEDMHFGMYSDSNDLYLFTNVIGSAIQYDAVQAGDIQFAGTYTTKDA